MSNFLDKLLYIIIVLNIPDIGFDIPDIGFDILVREERENLQAIQEHNNVLSKRNIHHLWV